MTDNYERNFDPYTGEPITKEPENTPQTQSPTQAVDETPAVQKEVNFVEVNDTLPGAMQPQETPKEVTQSNPLTEERHPFNNPEAFRTSANDFSSGTGGTNPPFPPHFAGGPGSAPNNPPKAPKPPKKKKYLSGGVIAAIVSVCVVVAILLGVGGTVLFLKSFPSILSSEISGSDSKNPEKDSASNKGETVDNASDRLTTADTANDDVLTVAQIADKVGDSVVEIVTEYVTEGFRTSYTSSGAGSGVVLTKDGYIVTNNHVIADANTIHVRLKNGDYYEAKLVGTDSQSDIAVLKIDATDLTVAVIGDSSKLVVGESCVAVGNPLGTLGGTVTNGIISALDREITIDGETMTLMQTNAAVNPGNSGGGLFNNKGELIGIVNAKSSGSDVEGLGFAIPVNTAQPVIEDLMEDGYVHGRFALGVTLLTIDNYQTAMYYGVKDYGVYIYSVTDGSNADAAGLEVGDLIVSIDGTTISTAEDVNSILDSHAVGDEMKFVVNRDDKEKSITVTLKETVPDAAA